MGPRVAGRARTTICSTPRPRRSSTCCRTGPDARSDIKRSLDQYYGLYDRIGMVASLRGPETAEGFLAFQERRNPSWVHPDLRTDGRL